MRAAVAHHAEYVGTLVKGRQVIAERAGHFVPIDQPELVIDAIREVVAASQSAGR